MKNVLILDVANNSILPFIHYYKKIGYTTYVADEERFSIGFFSNSSDFKIKLPFIPELVTTNEKITFFLEYIKNICKSYGIKLLLAFNENTLKRIIKNHRRLGILNIFPSFRSYLILHNKKFFYKKIEEFSPESFKIPKILNTKNLKFPCIIKPNIGSGGFLTYICKNITELKMRKETIEINGRIPIIQEYIPFEDKIAINLLIDKNYKIKRAIVRKVASVKKIMKVLEELESFFKEIRYFGFASPQFLLKKDTLYLTEINPRLSSVPFGEDYGLNFPEGFHRAIVEDEEIEERIFFLDKNYDVGNVVRNIILYKKKYKDILPSYMGIYKHIENKLKHYANIMISKEYKNIIEVVFGKSKKLIL